MLIEDGHGSQGDAGVCHPNDSIARHSPLVNRGTLIIDGSLAVGQRGTKGLHESAANLAPPPALQRIELVAVLLARAEQSGALQVRALAGDGAPVDAEVGGQALGAHLPTAAD